IHIVTGMPPSRPTRGRAGPAGPPFAGCELSWSLSRGQRLGRLDVDRLAAALGAELDGARDEGEERVVLAAADALPRVEVRAALADDDLAGVDDLAAEALDAQPLAVRVAAVPRGRCTL